jgi:hypothetical protein
MDNYLNNVLLSFFLIFIFSSSAVGQQYQSELTEADSLYNAGAKKSAKVIYKKAAEQGSAEAHFALAYKYVLPKKQQIEHYAAAAQKGHAEALKNALDELLFRANNLTLADPQRAFDLYHQAKKANSDLELFDVETKIEVMKMSIVSEDFNAQHFIKKYDVKFKEEGQDPYQIWKLAEEASRGGRFGEPDPYLVLALVVRGGFAPAELEMAVKDVYKDYKKGLVQPFNICNYVTSGYGMSFCASRGAEEVEGHRQFQMRKLKKEMNAKASRLLPQAYQAADAFIDAKAGQEEQHGGSGRGAWIINSKVKQKDTFVSLVDSVKKGFMPSPDHNFQQTDRQLNQTYKRTLQVLAKEDQPFQYFTKPKDLRAVQRLWIPYRDTSSKLFYSINPQVDLLVWKAWLTERRIGQLREIPGMEK